MIIADTGSTDGTKDINLANGVPVLEYLWNGSFADTRNFALSQETSDWNLVLDADEYLSRVDETKLQAFLHDASNIGSIKIVNRFTDNGEDAEAVSYIARLLPKGVRYTGDIHEQPDLIYPRKHVELEVIHGYYNRNKAERNIPLIKKALKSNPKDDYLHFQIAKEYRGIKQQLANFSDFHFVAALYLLDLILNNPQKYIQLLPQIESSYKSCIAIGDNNTIFDSAKGTGSVSAHHNLGAYYEVVGRINDASQCYKQAAQCEYAPPLERLSKLM